MKLTTILAALAGLGFVITSPSPTGLAAEPASALLKRGKLMIWNPPDAYDSFPLSKKDWEDKCDEALTRHGCVAGVIHQHQSQLTKPDGTKTSYVRVEGVPMEATRPSKRLHVYEDGSSEDFTQQGWPEHQSRSPKKKRPREPPTGQAAQGEASSSTSTPEPTRFSKSGVSWDPPGTYLRQGNKRKFWQTNCEKALAREGCVGGKIHQGQSTVTKADGPTMYVRVEGWPSVDTVHSKKLRVYEDGSSEDFSQQGWTEEDQKSITHGKRARRRKHSQVEPEPPLEASTTVGPPTTVSWNPPDAYVSRPFLRQSFDMACRQALRREGCKFGLIHQGHHVDNKPDGTFYSWMKVSAGQDEDNTKDMRLWEDGKSQWLPMVPLPSKDASKARVSPNDQPPHKRQKIGEATSSEAPN